MEYTLRALNLPQDKQQLASLLSTCFPLRHDPFSVITWKYENAPHGFISWIAESKDKEIIGLYTSIIMPTRYKEQYNHSSICVDMAVHPSFRGQGISTKLADAVYQEAAQQHLAFTIGFSNEQGIKVDQYAKNYKYQIVGKFQTYTNLFPFFTKKSLQTTIQLVDFKTYVSAINDNNTIPFWSLYKNSQYYKWKFSLNNLEEKKFLLIKKEHSVIGTAILINTGRQVFIQDILPVSDKDVQTVITEIITYAKNVKSVVSILVLNNAYWRRILLSNGFIPRRATHTYWLTIRKHTNEDIPNLFDNDYWWLMSGDLL